MLVNGLGAIATAATVIIVTVTKFSSGAWITTLLIPAILLLMYSIRRHYDQISEQIADAPPIDVGEIGKPIVVMPMFYWNKVARVGVEVALALSPEVYLLHVETHDERLEFTDRWTELIAEPARRAGLATPKLIVIQSPYRFVINPIVEHILNLQKTMPQRQIAVIISCITSGPNGSRRPCCSRATVRLSLSVSPGTCTRSGVRSGVWRAPAIRLSIPRHSFNRATFNAATLLLHQEMEPLVEGRPQQRLHFGAKIERVRR
jgi:hypothetical protein